MFPENLYVSRGEAGNSPNLAVMVVVGQHSRVTVHYYTMTSGNVARSENFGGKHFHGKRSCDLEATNESARYWEEISSNVTIKKYKAFTTPRTLRSFGAICRNPSSLLR